MRLTRLAVPLLALAYSRQAGFAQVALSSYVNFEGSQTSPVRLSPGGGRLFVVNTPDARLSVFDLAQPSNPAMLTEIPVGIEPVSVNARTEDEAWVVNQESDSISVVSVSRGIVTDTIQAKDEPADVVFLGNYAFVTASRSNDILVFDVTTHALVRRIPVFGGNPRALAVSADGRSVLAAFALSGNRSTLLNGLLAPPQPQPTNPLLPTPPRTGMIVDARDPQWSTALGYSLPDNDIVEIHGATLAVRGYYKGLGTINLGLAVHPGTGDLYVTNTEARNLIRFEPNLRGHWIDSRLTRLRRLSGETAVYDLNPGLDYGVLPNPPALATSISQPAGIVFTPSGATLYVASFGTDRVAKLDADGRILGRIEVGPASGSQVNPAQMRGPRGLAMHPTAAVLYVVNRISNTLTLINTASDRIIREIPTGTFDPTPSVIRAGRGFLYDAKLSGNGTGSCASCHIDADMDHLGWDLGNPGGSMTAIQQSAQSIPVHPMKGPLVTQSLRGLAGNAPYHWRGDRASFADFNGAFDSLMGGAAISAADMNAFTAFIDTVVYQPNPNQNLDRTLPRFLQAGDAQRGQSLFLNLPVRLNFFRCATCHLPPPRPGSANVIQNFAGQDQPMKIAQLRNIYQKLLYRNWRGAQSIDGFGLEHNGSFNDVFALLSAPGVFGVLETDTQAKLDLSAFVQSFDTGMAPAVGYSRTLTGASIDAALLDWIVLQGQAAAGNIELIVKGTVQGQRRGLLYVPQSNHYITDKSSDPPLRFAQLYALVKQSGDTLTVMGVPPGSGRRMGIDRNLDGTLDSN